MALLSFLSFIVIYATLYQCFVSAGDPVVYFPPFELRPTTGDSRFGFPVVNRQFQQQGNMRMQNQEPVLHTNPQNIPQMPSPQQSMEAPLSHFEKPHEENHSNVSVHDLLHALGIEDNSLQTDHSRAAGRDYGYPSGYGQYPQYQSYPQLPEYGYDQRPSYPSQYQAYPPAPYHQPSGGYSSPSSGHHLAPSKPYSKPIIERVPELVKPLATKAAGKISGLIGLVLPLLTGSLTENLELKGFADLVINGIVKPLLIAKGGLKTLISKLLIPVIALLLINLEVLVTVWWLWDDCPQPKPQVHQAYQYQKPAYGYSSGPYR